MKNFRLVAGVAVASSLALFSGTVFAQTFEVPANDGYVTDAANIIDDADQSALTQTITAYKEQTSNEIAIVTIQSLGGMAIEEAGLAIGRKWGVGSTKNNGILILVAYAEHDVRIDVGYGLEGAVPDLVAKGIIETDLVPAFREGEFGTGLLAAVQSLEKHIGGEYTAERYTDTSGEEGPLPFLFFFGFILLQWLFAILGRTKSWWLGGVFGGVAGIVLIAVFGWWLSLPVLVPLGLLLDYVVSKNFSQRGKTRWWAGGGFGPGGFGGGRGGGGFGGFGGGSFGGGGASGKW